MSTTTRKQGWPNLPFVASIFSGRLGRSFIQDGPVKQWTPPAGILSSIVSTRCKISADMNAGTVEVFVNFGTRDESGYIWASSHAWDIIAEASEMLTGELLDDIGDWFEVHGGIAGVHGDEFEGSGFAAHLVDDYRVDGVVDGDFPRGNAELFAHSLAERFRHGWEQSGTVTVRVARVPTRNVYTDWAAVATNAVRQRAGQDASKKMASERVVSIPAHPLAAWTTAQIELQQINYRG